MAELSIYESHRDAYLQIAKWIRATYAQDSRAGSPRFSQIARMIDLMGSDETMNAVDAFVTATQGGLSPDDLGKLYRASFDAIRHDLRDICFVAAGEELGFYHPIEQRMSRLFTTRPALVIAKRVVA